MSLLGGLQQDAAAFLGAQPFFTDTGSSKPRPISVLYEQLGDLQYQITQKVSTLGIVTVLLTVSGTNANPNAMKPYFKDIRIVARTYENVRINRGPVGTGQSASAVAEASALILHRWTPAGLSTALFCTDIQLRPPDPTKLLTYDTIFTIQAGMTDDTAVRSPWPAQPAS